MQYILTQQEYDELHSKRELRTAAQTAELQKLCTLAAQHIPVTLSWALDKTPEPWGCILGPSDEDPCYCDECPAQEVCPNESKEWSK